ncbi:E3 ubiquitin-protein ligase TRAF7-like isoform X1 [Ruditapes philippinarum]|uniref:E3 ubiquitin-protein ligase TRAF7-like isoform X1 n=1 Tax=Ruditapes philippinarum TaxID=129788 RepID=UPI00295B3B6B|nr:E3 ubiquitin-protein ligase TRAF7-like isoform X1 [Ruditapes philippinarum]
MSQNQDDSPVVFDQEPSQHFKCPSCQKLYIDPVINIGCGHTFCKNCSQQISTCPVDGNACDANQMVVNRLVVGQIDDLLIYCKYGLVKQEDTYVPDPTGCQQKIHLGSRSSHEDECDFAPITCSNRNCTASLRKGELDEHQKVCVYITCAHEDKGCEFQGRQEEVTEHGKICGYRGLQNLSKQSAGIDQKTIQLEESNKDLQKQITTLNMRVGQLEESNTSLQGQLTECLGSMKEMQQKFDGLVSSIEQLTSVKNRRSYGSPGNTGEPRSRSSSHNLYQEIHRSFRKSLSGSPPLIEKYERWNMPFQFKCIGTLRGHQNVVWCMASKNKKLFTAGSDCCIKVWDLENLQRGCIKTIQGHTKSIQCMCIGGNFLYTGGHDNSVYCWSLDDYNLVNMIENAHDNIICAMAVIGDFLFTSSFSLIKVWESKSLILKHTIPGLHHWVRALALNPEKDKLYSGSHNTIDIWSVTEPFALKGKVDHQFGSIYSLAVTSKYIIAGTYNHNLQLFDVKNTKHLLELMGHIGVVHSIVPSVSGRFLFSASIDKSIQIWNLENMLPIQTLQRHEGSVNTLVVHGDFLFSGSEDKEIKVFMYFQMQMGFSVNT